MILFPRCREKLFLTLSPSFPSPPPLPSSFPNKINLSLNSSCCRYNSACAQFSRHNSQSLHFKCHIVSRIASFSRETITAWRRAARTATAGAASRISYLRRRSSVYYANINININSLHARTLLARTYVTAVIVSRVSRVSAHKLLWPSHRRIIDSAYLVAVMDDFGRGTSDK